MQDSLPQMLEKLAPSLTTIAFCLFGVLASAIAIYSGYRRMQAVGAAWQDVAMRTGLTFQAGNFLMMPSLSGEFRRRRLLMNTFSRGSGRSRTTYTRVALTLKAPGAGSLALSPQGFLSGIGKALGMQDVEIGSERFDSAFMVKGNPPELAQSVFGDPILQDQLIELRQRVNFTLELSGDSLSFTEVGVPRDADYLEAVYNMLSDLADKLDGGSKGSWS